MDVERSRRYWLIFEALKVNPDLRFPDLDKILPLPPAKLPEWNGFEAAFPVEDLDNPSY
ncbi:DUF6396 domain-containing protein [Pseudoduganella albidiflava]|uniref:DUF6396 domain-containing protein n=1 Tax=Pseudoduganella albidiflava TaxID=321983 RepID=UPI00353112CC